MKKIITTVLLSSLPLLAHAGPPKPRPVAVEQARAADTPRVLMPRAVVDETFDLAIVGVVLAVEDRVVTFAVPSTPEQIALARSRGVPEPRFTGAPLNHYLKALQLGPGAPEEVVVSRYVGKRVKLRLGRDVRGNLFVVSLSTVL